MRRPLPFAISLASFLPALVLSLATISCSSGSSDSGGEGEHDPAERVTMRTPTSTALGRDAGAPATAPATAPAPVPEPVSEDRWLDPPPTSNRWGGRAAPQSKPRTREAGPLAIQLRSTPPGATVMVDGRRVGVTPAYWEGYADGKNHDFVFILPQYAVAHYRFVPVQSGHVHPVLERILEPENASDAGLPSPPALH